MLAATTTQPMPVASHYTVRRGDTLSGITVRDYGKHASWLGLWQENQQVKNPDVIVPGEQLRTPEKLPADITVSYVVPSYKPKHAAAMKVYQPKHAKFSPVAHASPVARHAAPVAHHVPAPASSSVYSTAELAQLWESAGGPAGAASEAARVAECESGGRTNAYNPSGATGLWQILGSVRPGNLYDPSVNAANAVAKYEASGDTWAQWTCQP